MTNFVSEPFLHWNNDLISLKIPIQSTKEYHRENFSASINFEPYSEFEVWIIDVLVDKQYNLRQIVINKSYKLKFINGRK